MSVILSSGGHIKPGRYVDFVATAHEAAKIYERLGTRPPRLMSAGIAGEAFGTWTFSVEFDDLESFGEISDRFNADSDAQEFMMRVQGDQAPSALEHVVAALEVPIHTSTGRQGSQMAVYVSKIHPGQEEEAYALAARACTFAEANGAVNARAWSLLQGGSAPGLTMMTWEFESMRAFAGLIGAFMTDTDGQALRAASVAVAAPSTQVFEALYSEIPL